MDFLQLLRAFLQQAYKMQDTEIDALINADTTDQQAALSALLAKDQERITGIKQPLIGKFQEGQNAGKKAALDQLEAMVKEQYGITSDAKGLDLISEIVAQKSQATGVTDDAVKRHTLYQELERARNKAIQDKEAEWQAKYDAREKEYSYGETFGTVQKKALDLLADLNPIIPTNAKVAENYKNTFIQALKNGYTFDVQDNGKRIVVMDKDGKVIDDGHGNSIDFKDLVKNTAPEYFEFKANNGGGNNANGGDEGNANGGGAPGYPAGIKKPVSFEEFANIMNDTNIPIADRKIVNETWQAENK